MKQPTHALPYVLIGLFMVGFAAFIVGASIAATTVFGPWVGVAVGGLSIAVVASVVLYAVGSAADDGRDDETPGGGRR